MNGEQIATEALAYVRGQFATAARIHAENPPPGVPAPVLPTIVEDSPIVAWTLARWAAYGDPVPLPVGWPEAKADRYAGPTGIRQIAVDPTGQLYNDAPARRIPWTCPAGVLHRRYWRSAHHPNRPPYAACEHVYKAVPLPREPSAIEELIGRLQPVVLVDISEGVERATYEYPGTGSPRVEVQDFDAEGTEDRDRLHLAERAELFASLIRERSDHPNDLTDAERYETDAREWRADIAEAEADEARRRAASLADV